MSDTQVILDSFRRVVRALRLNSQEVQAQCGLSGAQLFVLQKITPGEAISVNEIAERTNTDQSSVSVVVSKLVARKLLQRKPSIHDRRKMLHSLSARGVAIVERSHFLIQNRLLDAIDSLSKSEKTDLSKLLAKVIAKAELSLEPATLFFEDEKKKKHVRSNVRGKAERSSTQP